MTETVVALLERWPWLPYVWLGASLACVALRAYWPKDDERPRWCVALLAVLDILQANPSGFLKPILRQDRP